MLQKRILRLHFKDIPPAQDRALAPVDTENKNNEASWALVFRSRIRFDELIILITSSWRHGSFPNCLSKIYEWVRIIKREQQKLWEQLIRRRIEKYGLKGFKNTFWSWIHSLLSCIGKGFLNDFGKIWR